MTTTDNASLPEPAPLWEWWSDTDEDLSVPEGQTNAKRRWTIIIMTREGSKVTEYEVRPDRKIRLTQSLDLLLQQLREVASQEPEAFGFRVY